MKPIKLTKMTLARIRELDAKRDMEMIKFLRLGVAYGTPPPLFLHEEYEGQLPEMAVKFKVPLEELEAYVWVQAYINASAHGSYAELPLPEDVARQLGIPTEDFDDYLHTQTWLIRDALADDDDEDEALVLPVQAEDWDLQEGNLKKKAKRRAK